jgi:hypothetical protein
MSDKKAAATWTGTGVPDWMAAFGIKPGEWLDVAKFQLRSQMRPGPGRTLKSQVWACGILHTAGYKGERAITMHGGKKFNLTPAVIIRELHAEALEYYRSAGVEITDDQSKKLKETKEHVRRSIEDLEDDGVCDRKADGASLQTLSTEQRQRLPSGRIEYHFYLKPQAANPEAVKKEWARFVADPTSPHDVSKVEVATGWLPPVPISQVLKAFGFERPGKEVITSPDYQKIVSRAWESAKKVFETEVAMGWLPQVAVPSPPEVVATGGAFESKGESKVERRPSSSSTLIDKRPEPRPVGSQKLTTTNPPEAPPAPKYATDSDELVALIQKNTGRLPDQKLVRDIAEKVELRGFTLRLFLDDIGPRIPRLAKPPGEGFFLSHAGKFGGVETTLVPEPETVAQKAERTGPCKKCRGVGKVDGAYCDCRMGHDLERVEKRRKEGELASHA